MRILIISTWLSLLLYIMLLNVTYFQNIQLYYQQYKTPDDPRRWQVLWIQNSLAEEDVGCGTALLAMVGIA